MRIFTSLMAFLALMAPTAAHAAAERIAIVPAGAERITVDEMAALQRIEDIVRAAAGAVPSWQVLAEAQTKKELATVKEMGIACELGDVACLSKVAVLVEVDRVVVPIVRFERDSTTLRIVLVDAAGGTAEASRAVPAGEPWTVDAARQLLEEAIARAPTAAAPTAPPAPPTTNAPPSPSSSPSPSPSPSSSSSSSPPAPQPSPSLLVPGAIVAGAGALVAVGCGVGAVVVHDALGAREPYDARVAKMVGGQALLYSSIAGAIGVAVGGAMMILPE